MIPKYTQVEISKRIQKEIEFSGLDQVTFAKHHDYDTKQLRKLLSPNLIWLAQDYQRAATILKTTPEILLEHLPQEDLDSISFRALENTEEINHRVKQLDDIFQLLTYQLKIGSESRD